MSITKDRYVRILCSIDEKVDLLVKLIRTARDNFSTEYGLNALIGAAKLELIKEAVVHMYVDYINNTLRDIAESDTDPYVIMSLTRYINIGLKNILEY